MSTTIVILHMAMLLMVGAAFGSDLKASVSWGSLNSSSIKSVPDEAFKNITKNDFVSIPLEAWEGISAAQIYYLPDKMCNNLNETQLIRIRPVVLGHCSSTWYADCFKDSPTRIMRSLTLEQLFFLQSGEELKLVSPSIFAGMKPVMASNFPVSLCEGFTSAILGSIPLEAFQALSKECFEKIPSDCWQSIDPSSIPYMPPAFLSINTKAIEDNIFQRLTPLQLSELPGSFCSERHVTEFADHQIEFISSECISKLSRGCSEVTLEMWERWATFDNTEQLACVPPLGVLLRASEWTISHFEKLDLSLMDDLELEELFSKRGDTFIRFLAGPAAYQLMASRWNYVVKLLDRAPKSWTVALPKDVQALRLLTALQAAMLQNDTAPSVQESQLWNNANLNMRSDLEPAVAIAGKLAGLRPQHIASLLQPDVIEALHVPNYEPDVQVRLFNSLSASQFEAVAVFAFKGWTSTMFSGMADETVWKLRKDHVPYFLDLFDQFNDFCSVWDRLSPQQRQVARVPPTTSISKCKNDVLSPSVVSAPSATTSAPLSPPSPPSVGAPPLTAPALLLNGDAPQSDSVGANNKGGDYKFLVISLSISASVVVVVVILAAFLLYTKMRRLLSPQTTPGAGSTSVAYEPLQPTSSSHQVEYE